MNDTQELKLAARAEGLARDGLKGRAIGQKLGIATGEANRLLNIAHCQGRLKIIGKMRLADSERVLILTLAALWRERLGHGLTRSIESKSVSWHARRSPGWAVATVNRRIGGRDGNSRMGLVTVTGNGYLQLTEMGWIVVHALEGAAE